MNMSRFQKGFTFLEIIIVISIMMIILSAGFYTFSNLNRNSRNQKREIDVETIRSALEKFKSDNPTHTYPDAIASVVPQYMSDIPRDPRTRQRYNLSSPEYSLGVCLTPSPPGLCSSYQFYVPLEPTGTSYLVANQYTTFVVTTPPVGPTAYPSVRPPSPTRTPTPTMSYIPIAQIPSHYAAVVRSVPSDPFITFSWSYLPKPPITNYSVRIYSPSGSLLRSFITTLTSDNSINTTGWAYSGDYTWTITACNSPSCSGSSIMGSGTYRFTYVPPPAIGNYTCYWNGSSCMTYSNCNNGNPPASSSCMSAAEVPCRSLTNVSFSCN